MTRGGKRAINWLLSLCMLVSACVLLAACGQKGPLILPEPAEAEIGQNATQAGDDQQDGEDDDAGGN